MDKQQLLDSAISSFLDLLQTRIQGEEFNVNPDNLAEEKVRITALDSDGEPLQSSEQGLDEWGGKEDLVAKEWGGATAESLASFFSKGAEKIDLPALTASELKQAVHLEIQIGDPEDQGIRTCMPLYPMRHLNLKHIIVEESVLGKTNYAFAQTPSHGWHMAYGRINHTPLSMKLFQGETVVFSTPSYERHKVLEPYPGVTPFRGNLIALHSDHYRPHLEMILHEDHRGVEVLLNQLPWGPAPLVSLNKELQVTATHQVHGMEPHPEPTSFESIHHLIDTLDRTFFYDNFETY